MPIEIRELIVRAVVTDARPAPEAVAPGAETEEARQALVEACVRQVLKILKRSKER